MEKLFLGVDQGTSSTKAVVVRADGALLWEDSREVALHVGQGGVVTQSPEELAESVRFLLDEALRVFPNRIQSIGLSFQRSGVCAWEGARVVHPLMSHQDTSLQPAIDALKDSHEKITELTGLPVLPGFAGAKIAFLQSSYPAACVGTLDSFVLRQLSGGTASHCEHTMAARTMLYELSTRRWSPALCALFGVDAKRLPTIRNTLAHHMTYGQVPVMAMVGDQQAALLAAIQLGSKTVLNLGTIASLAFDSGPSLVRRRGVVTSVLCAKDEHLRYLAEGILPACGGLLMRLKGHTENASLATLDQWCAEIAEGNPPTHGFFVVESTGTPDWNAAAPSVYRGPLEKRSIVHAAVDHIAFSIADLLALLDEYRPVGSHEITVLGGLTELNALLQRISDASGYTVHARGVRSATAIGAAMLAAQAVGVDLQVPKLSKERSFTPERSRLAERLLRWQALRNEVQQGTVRDEPFKL